MVWVQSLGTLKDKSERLMNLAGKIATAIGSKAELAQRAAKLCKTDLISDMVFEFTDLQGLAGSYYAKHDGEHADVCAAMVEQYQPAFSGHEHHLPKLTAFRALRLE